MVNDIATSHPHFQEHISSLYRFYDEDMNPLTRMQYARLNIRFMTMS